MYCICVCTYTKGLYLEHLKNFYDSTMKDKQPNLNGIKDMERGSASLVIGKMQIYITVRNHFKPTDVAKITKATPDVGKDVRQQELSYFACGRRKWCSRPGESFGSFLKSLNLHLPWDVSFLLLGISLGRNENIYPICPKKDVHVNVHGSFINKISKLETTQMSLNRRMRKQTLIRLYNEIQLSNNMEKISETFY